MREGEVVDDTPGALQEQKVLWAALRRLHLCTYNAFFFTCFNQAARLAWKYIMVIETSVNPGMSSTCLESM
jgi:hypothetical protein